MQQSQSLTLHVATAVVWVALLQGVVSAVRGHRGSFEACSFGTVDIYRNATKPVSQCAQCDIYSVGGFVTGGLCLQHVDTEAPLKPVVSVRWIFTEMQQSQSLTVHSATAVVWVALLQGLCLQYVDTEGNEVKAATHALGRYLYSAA
jgi:hypothetical protein